MHEAQRAQLYHARFATGTRGCQRTVRLGREGGRGETARNGAQAGGSAQPLFQDGRMLPDALRRALGYTCGSAGACTASATGRLEVALSSASSASRRAFLLAGSSPLEVAKVAEEVAAATEATSTG
mmetsp:Transcript_18555/g.55992  ORF Transcript_18555/g.55992 Transcript_18555/m.55992 type:complete len:126 (-) Transcript_18555:775-1152(-)|eukprot:scaffold2713_cov24-Tisochrysis_lutea.AAC.2